MKDRNIPRGLLQLPTGQTTTGNPMVNKPISGAQRSPREFIPVYTPLLQGITLPRRHYLGCSGVFDGFTLSLLLASIGDMRSHGEVSPSNHIPP
jgi:hypothetical protein